jgi:hypothetical protein
MGHKLYREIKRGAPPEWDSGMRLVALAIADDAGEQTRRTFGYQIEGYWRKHGKGWRNGISDDTGLDPGGVTKALRRLAAAGYDMRIPIGKDKTGRLIYAVRNHASDYCVPPLAPRRPPERVPHRAPKLPERVDHRAPFDAGKGALQGTPISSEDLSPQKTYLLTKSLSPVTAAAATRPETNHQDQDQQRQVMNPTARAAELIICAYLAVAFGLDQVIDGPPRLRRLVTWQQRTIPTEWHGQVPEVTRYLLRCYRAAPDQMRELAVLKYDDDGYPEFGDDAAPVLKAMRREAKRYELAEAHEAWCDRLSDRAYDEAAEGRLDDDGRFVDLTDTDAIETGAAWARADHHR